MSIREKVLKECISRLDVLGCKYLIIADDGTRYGTLKLELEKAVKGLREKRVLNRFEALNIRPKLETMKPGEVVSFELPEGSTRSQLQSAICSMAFGLFGTGNYTTSANYKPETDKYSVEIIRL